MTTLSNETKRVNSKRGSDDDRSEIRMGFRIPFEIFYFV